MGVSDKALRARAAARRRPRLVRLLGASALAGLALGAPGLAQAADPPDQPLPASPPPAPSKLQIGPPQAQTLTLPQASDRPIAVNLIGRFGLELPPEKLAHLQTLELAREHSLGLDGLTLKTGPAEELKLGGADSGFPPPVDTAPSRKPWVVAMVGNDGGEEARPWRLGVTVGLPNATNPDTITRLGLFHGLVNSNQAGAHLSSTMILNARGLGVHADLAYVRYAPYDKVPPSLNFAVRTAVARAELDQAIYARGADFAGLRAGVEAIDQYEDLLTGPPNYRDHIRNAFAGATARMRHGATYAEAELQALKGLAILGASRPSEHLLSHADADPQAFFVRGALKAGHPLFGGILEARLRGQWSNHPQPVFENFVYQGFEPARDMDPMALRTDRGMDPRVMRADRGGVGGLEYSHRGPHLLGGTLSPFVFAEHAESWNIGHFGARYSNATIAGGGLRLSLPKRVDAELEYSAPVVPIRGLFSADMGKPRLLFVMAKRFGG
jgi:hemolysin activation/secretion protein